MEKEVRRVLLQRIDRSSGDHAGSPSILVSANHVTRCSSSACFPLICLPLQLYSPHRLPPASSASLPLPGGIGVLSRYSLHQLAHAILTAARSIRSCLKIVLMSTPVARAARRDLRVAATIALVAKLQNRWPALTIRGSPQAMT
jgi:hypothetical protein